MSFTPSASSGWGYAMIAAEADYATLTIQNVKAFMSAVGDATCAPPLRIHILSFEFLSKITSFTEIPKILKAIIYIINRIKRYM